MKEWGYTSSWFRRREKGNRIFLTSAESGMDLSSPAKATMIDDGTWTALFRFRRESQPVGRGRPAAGFIFLLQIIRLASDAWENYRLKEGGVVPRLSRRCNQNKGEAHGRSVFVYFRIRNRGASGQAVRSDIRRHTRCLSETGPGCTGWPVKQR